MSNPFSAEKSKAGEGSIYLALLPPSTPRLRTVRYQYPLKLVSPAPITVDTQLVHTVYLLTYGGGLVAGDAIDLDVHVEADTRLTLLTQGSTKLFKSPNRELGSRQCMTTALDPGAALCYLPDPVQPFDKSCFDQSQIYNCAARQHDAMGSLCVLDWVSNGRSANGEDWSFYRYSSRNEIWLLHAGQRRLLLRDNLVLDDHGETGSITSRMNGLSVFGTLFLYGPLYKRLADFFMSEFKLHPRIGGRQWNDSEVEQERDHTTAWRDRRQQREVSQNFLWSAASIRGCVTVKFGARELEHARHWLYDMLSFEGTIVNNFGERALLCLR
ncbi:hypothetical protein AMS68_000473 [Peltaster fructicola]|uniref:Urease accessory protein UreD n=1 Tax=Peltaster fructicola TaxID=286661 RepID=A0A6H0XJR5_9PEZI|nr:hypothetical protein AMS68_000473 [Peltaster fructicola]